MGLEGSNQGEALSIDGQFTDEREPHSFGRFACAKYAAARRSTSFSCSNNLARKQQTISRKHDRKNPNLCAPVHTRKLRTRSESAQGTLSDSAPALAYDHENEPPSEDRRQHLSGGRPG